MLTDEEAGLAFAIGEYAVWVELLTELLGRGDGEPTVGLGEGLRRTLASLTGAESVNSATGGAAAR